MTDSGVDKPPDYGTKAHGADHAHWATKSLSDSDTYKLGGEEFLLTGSKGGNSEHKVLTAAGASFASTESHYLKVAGMFDVPRHTWASDASSEDEKKSKEECQRAWWFVEESGGNDAIIIPEDMKDVYPKGYSNFKEATERFNFRLVESGPKLIQCGLRFKECYGNDVNAAKERFSRLDKAEQLSVSTMMTLNLLLCYKPNKLVAAGNKTCVPTSYVLSIFLKAREGESSISKILKHEDGGRSLVLERLKECFSSNAKVAEVLMSSYDKLFRSIAKEGAGRVVLEESFWDLAEKTCHTSDEGLLGNCYRIQKKRVAVDKPTSKGGRVKEVETVIRVGRVAPNLQTGSDVLKESERALLKEIAESFSVLKKYQALSLGLRSASERIRCAESVVREAYRLTDPISSVIKRRKGMIRAQIVAPEKGKPLPSDAWARAAVSVIAQSETIEERVYENLKRFNRSEDH